MFLVLQFALPNPLKPGVKSRMTIYSEQVQIHLSDQQFAFAYYIRFWRSSWLSLQISFHQSLLTVSRHPDGNDIRYVFFKVLFSTHGLLPKYVKLWVAHAPGMPERFPRYRRLAIPTCIKTRSWRTCRDALTGGFLRSRWRKKCSRHSRRMHNPQYYVFGKRPMRWKYFHRPGCGLIKLPSLNFPLEKILLMQEWNWAPVMPGEYESDVPIGN